MILRDVGGSPDIGAYEFFKPFTISESSEFMGHLNADGVFVETAGVYIYTNIKYHEQVEQATNSNNSRYLKIKIPQHRKTDKSSVYVDVVGINEDGSSIPDAITQRIYFTKKGSDSDNYIFISNKPVVFIDSKLLQGENQYSTALLMTSGRISYILYASQF